MLTTRLIYRMILAVLAIAGIAAAADNAAPPGPLKGVVLDESGAVIPGATVRLLNKVTQQSQRTTSDENGEFQFALEPNGDYVVSVRAQGFQSREAAVRPQQVGTGLMRFRMDISESSEKITVTAQAFAAPSVDNPINAIRLSDNFMRDLPHKNGDPLAIPSMFASPAVTGGGSPKLIVDGVETDSLDLPESAIKQVTINQSPYSAEFSRPGRGRLDVITNKGSHSRVKTNLSFALRNPSLNAREPFARTHPLDQRDVFDGEVDGPITRLLSATAAVRYDRENAHGVVNALKPEGEVIENVPELYRRTNAFLRLDYRSPSRTDKAILTYKFKNKSDRGHLIGGFNLPEHGEDVFDHENEIKLNESHMGSAMLNQFSLTLRQERSDLAAVSREPGIIVLDAFNGSGSGEDQHLRGSGATIQDYITLTRGVHAIRFGGAAKIRSLHLVDAVNFFGTYRFSSLEEYISHQPYEYDIAVGNPVFNYGHHEFGTFVQDDIRLRPNLSVLVGIRHEAQTGMERINNFAPRFGFAFSPGKHTTVLRGGAGIFYERRSVEVEREALDYDGSQIHQIILRDPTFPVVLTAPGPLSAPPSITRMDPRARPPYLFQATAGIDRHLGRGAISFEYATLRGVHLYRSRNINAPYANGDQPDLAYGNIQQIESSGMSRSNALIVTLRAQSGRKTDWLVHYTLSRSNDDVGTVLRLPANNYDLHPEWGRADFDTLHRLNFMGTHRLPGDVRFGWIANWRSGVPYDIKTGRDDNNDSVANDRPAGGRRNTGNGPAYSNIDLRLARDIHFGPDSRVQVRLSVEGFNVLNHISYRNFIGTLTSPFFGRANAAYPARQLQFTMSFKL